MPHDPTPSPQEQTPPMPNLRLTSSPADEPLPKVLAANIPLELRNMPRWMAWQYQTREGKTTKVPIGALTGMNADYTDPREWRSFEQVWDRVEMDASLDGVAFVFAEGDGLCGIDLDQCVDESGELSLAARTIVDEFASYTEISPSGRGVKIFVRGTKPPGSKCRTNTIEGMKQIEVYDHDRMFTVTGKILQGSPREVNEAQEALTGFCEHYLRPTPPRNSHPPQPVTSMDDATLLARARSASNGGKFMALFDRGETTLYGGDDSAADLGLCSMLAFWAGGDAAQIDRLFRASGLYREKWEREDYRTNTIATAIAGCTAFYGAERASGGGGGGPALPAPASASPPSSKAEVSNSSPSSPRVRPDEGDDRRPPVLITVNEYLVLDQVAEALCADPDLYARGGALVRLAAGTTSPVAALALQPSIALVQPPTLREKTTKFCKFLRSTERGLMEAHPPAWVIHGLLARGTWPGIRPIAGISDIPVLRRDGSIFQTRGYDERTGIYYKPTAEFPPIPENPDILDAKLAIEDLGEVIVDFTFETPEHRAGWFAGLLTPIARHAFDGCSPLFLIDANVRGAGKGLLAQCIGEIALGRAMPVSSLADSSEEMRKRITAIAIAADPVVLFDNLDGKIGNPVLDAALTTTVWRDRVLGKSEQIELPLTPVWYATGNNVQVGADTARRIVPVRLEVLEERPEDRSGFKHPNLLKWVRQERPRLVTAALTILAAYLRAGSPDQHLTPMGSFEGWSGLVRSALVWAGLPDPCATSRLLAETSDTVRESLVQLHEAWSMLDPDGEGLVVAEMLARLYPASGERPSDTASVAMRAALEDLVSTPAGKPPQSRQVARHLKAVRQRVVGGRYLDHSDVRRAKGVVWVLKTKGGARHA
jgi:hypothetical protein